MGEVRLSTREYEELIAMKIKMEQAIAIELDWYDRPRVHVDIRAFEDIVRDKFKSSKYVTTHTLLDPDKNWETTLEILEDIPIPEDEEAKENGATEEGL